MNNHKVWTGNWISSSIAQVSEEPEFTLEEMFSGKMKEQLPIEERLHPAVYFKKIFSIELTTAQATLRITSQGIYHAYLNGQKVTEAIFTPDYTSYGKFLMYQTYDVTSLLVEGQNVLAIEVADGWYAGRISVEGGSAQFGSQLAVLAELEIVCQDGQRQVIGTDADFTSGSGKHRYADIQIGERQDLRLDDDWKTNWTPLSLPAIIIDADYSRLAPQEGPMVSRKQWLPVQDIWEEEESLIVDFGQVIAGRVGLNAFLKEGQEIRIEHAETLDEQGKFLNNIIGRNKDAVDSFIGRGQKDYLEPDFTFHGFRYVRISGLEREDLQDIQAIAIYSDMRETGQIRTSDTRLNQLLSNILWSQRGNMLSIPTDCPQRERVGWTGDMQVFAPSSTFYMDTEAFISRWLKSVRIDQRENGEIMDYSPAPKDAEKSILFTGSYSSAGWGDAVIMVPWTLYEKYGHQQVLTDNYEAMLKWLDFAKKSAAGDKKGLDQYIWNTKFHYGDWMFPSLMMGSPNPMRTAEVTKDLIATAFLAHSYELVGKISDILGKDSRDFYAYAQHVREAFTVRFIKEDGRLTSDFQGCYVVALAFNLVPGEKKEGVFQRLVHLIKENGNRLDTGFVSVPYLLEVLCRYGKADLAKTVFLQDSCPSWFYEVDKGATTIWESWSNIQPDGQVGSLSFNHYAFGCVLEWIIREVVGLKVLEAGYQAVEIRPSLELVETFDFHYQSVNGEIHIQKDGSLWSIHLPKHMKHQIDLVAVSGILL